MKKRSRNRHTHQNQRRDSHPGTVSPAPAGLPRVLRVPGTAPRPLSTPVLEGAAVYRVVLHAGACGYLAAQDAEPLPYVVVVPADRGALEALIGRQRSGGPADTHGEWSLETGADGRSIAMLEVYVNKSDPTRLIRCPIAFALPRFIPLLAALYTTGRLAVCGDEPHPENTPPTPCLAVSCAIRDAALGAILRAHMQAAMPAPYRGASGRRGDAPLVAHLLARYGLDCALRYQENLPYLVLPGGGFEQELTRRQEELCARLRQLCVLPWPDAMYDFGEVLTASNPSARGQLLVRITRGDVYLAARTGLSPWLRRLPEGLADLMAGSAGARGTIVVEIWMAVRNTGPMLIQEPIIGALPIDGRAWSLQELPLYHYGDGRPQDGNLARAFGASFALAVLTLGYLNTVADEFVVAVQPQRTPAQQRQDAKGRTRRPHLRDGLPYFILLDPIRARRLAGEQAGAEQEQDAEHRRHASPVRHRRRGHPRTYRHRRYVHMQGKTVEIAPTWVGTRSWTVGRLLYRVIAPPRWLTAGMDRRPD